MARLGSAATRALEMRFLVSAYRLENVARQIRGEPLTRAQRSAGIERIMYPEDANTIDLVATDITPEQPSVEPKAQVKAPAKPKAPAKAKAGKRPAKATAKEPTKRRNPTREKGAAQIAAELETIATTPISAALGRPAVGEGTLEVCYHSGFVAVKITSAHGTMVAPMIGSEVWSTSDALIDHQNRLDNGRPFPTTPTYPND